MENNTILCEYRIKCPECESEILVVTESVAIIVIPCQGCDNAIVLLNSSIFTVPLSYIKELASKYKIRMCGKILGAQISLNSKLLITDNKLSELHNLLEQPMDVSEFIKKIK